MYEAAGSDNALGADNQQERLSIDEIPEGLGNFLAGFAMGEGSFMLSCLYAHDRNPPRWRIIPAFNVSQHDKEPLELLKETLRCGEFARGGSGGWYWTVTRNDDLRQIIVPFFERFPLMGKKQEEVVRFKQALALLDKTPFLYSDFVAVLEVREQMNNGGKRRHTMESILRDYTPDSFYWAARRRPRRR